MTDNSTSRYKWYILALGTATHIFVYAMARMSMPVLFKEIADDLGLDLVQIGMIWGISGLAGVFLAIVSGLLGDRYGTRMTLGIACLLQGLTGGLRGLAGDFNSLVAYTFLFGLFSVPLSLTTHKAASEWFSGRQLGLANGVLAMGVGLGITAGTMFSATVFSPLLGSWRNLMFVYGAVAIVVGLLWLQVRRKPDRVEATHLTEAVSFRQALLHVTKIRAVWLLAISDMFLTGCSAALVGYLPLHLRTSGWTPVGADGALAALSAASVLGVIPLSLLSDKIGLRKAVVYPSILITVVCVGLLSIFTSAVVWPIVIMLGIVREGLAAITITMSMETEGVGPTYAGTALGIVMSLCYLGSFIAPPIGNRLAVISPSFAFLFWSGLAFLALCVFYFTEETGWRKKAALIQETV